MKDTETKQRFVELRGQGWSFDRIAKELKTSKQTLLNWSREFNVEIANFKAMQLDLLQEQYALTKLKRLELFGGQLNNLKTELGKRELEDLPTDKLCGLLLKYGAMIKAEEIPVEFREEEETSVNLMKNLWHSIARWEA